MRKLDSRKMTFLALAAVLNIAGGLLAQALRLPIYLDTLGTLFAAATLGPVYGMIPGLLSNLISGITTDPYALYYTPVQILTGLTAGFLLYGKGMRIGRFFLSGILITLPSTLLAAWITAKLFGGLTSSGSSVLVLFLHRRGLGLTESVFLVQVFTDLSDKLLCLYLALRLKAMIPRRLLMDEGREGRHGEIQ